VATFQFALAHGEPKRLSIKTTGAFASAAFLLDDEPLETVDNKEVLMDGIAILLPDGRTLDVRLERRILFDWDLSIDGRPLPKSHQDIPGAIADSISMVRWGVVPQILISVWNVFRGQPFIPLELLPAALAALGGLLLWKRSRMAVPALVGAAVAWQPVSWLFGYWSWFSAVWSFVMIGAALRSRALLEAERLQIVPAGGGTSSPVSVAAGQTRDRAK